jgi:hypothetical protein
MIDDREFDEKAEAHEFSELQAEFLRTYLTQPGHHHDVEEIDEFDDAVGQLVDDLLDEEDD